MIAEKIMKNPILVLGILMMVIFLYQLQGKYTGFNRREKLMPTSCRAVMFHMKKYTPDNWQWDCEKNHLKINISEDLHQQQKRPKLSLDEAKQMTYRLMANHFSYLAQVGPHETIERTDSIIMTLTAQYKNPQELFFTIRANTTGAAVAKLKYIKEPKYVADHLRLNVLVQELPQKP